MPFGVIGVLLVILLILAAIFGLLSYLAGPVLAMAIFFILACSLMILVVLIQRPKGGGLAGAFGGVGGAQQTAFGAKVGDVLTATNKPGKSWEKEGKRSGKLVFSESITEYRDQDGELVVTAIGTGVRWH